MGDVSSTTCLRRGDLSSKVENMMPWGPRRRPKQPRGVAGTAEIIGCRRSVSAALCCRSSHRRCSGCCSGRPCRSDYCCRRSRRCPPHLQRQTTRPSVDMLDTTSYEIYCLWLQKVAHIKYCVQGAIQRIT